MEFKNKIALEIRLKEVFIENADITFFNRLDTCSNKDELFESLDKFYWEIKDFINERCNNENEIL